MNIPIILQAHLRFRLQLLYLYQFYYTLRKRMTFADFIDKTFWGMAGAIVTGLTFMVFGGVRKGRAETDTAIIDGIKSAGEFLASSNSQLQKSIVEQTNVYEKKINDLIQRFDLKEKSLILKIENLELENKNLKLENANLALENDRLMKASGMRKIS